MNLKEIISDRIWTYPLSEIHYGDRCIINTINPHSYCEAKKDEVFSDALRNCDVLLPDGSGIVLAAKVLNGKRIKKIAGADLHQFLLKNANRKSQKVFYLGSEVSTLRLIQKRINNEFPNIEVESFSPPYKEKFSDKETATMLSEIKKFQPDILFVGMTAPKQEKWVFMNQAKIKVHTIASIGAVFDFYAGTVKRSGPIWIKLGLEWLPRLVKDPIRLWRRNFISNPLFLLDLIKAKIL